MIAAFLSPYPFRGVQAPYLWVFYKLLSAVDEPMAFLLSADYLESPSAPLLSGRSELDGPRQSELGYSVPNASDFDRHNFAMLDPDLMLQLLPRYGGNPLAFFKAFLSEEIPEVKDAIDAGLSSLPSDIEVILSWSNCPSLAAVAARRGIKVIYLEVGPLREPQYRSTAYLDFSGVNGNTEAERRYQAGAGFLPADVQLASLRRAFSSREAEKGRHGERLGVALQVEDDSNLISFSNGFDNISLIAKALLGGSGQQLLIRSHPGSRFQTRLGVPEHDVSATVADFLVACDKVLCVNSSVGLEAIMLGIDTEIEGDASYRFVAEERDDAQRARKLAFFLLAYLVPYAQVFSPDYIRFRLKQPTEVEIIRMHLIGYGVSSDSSLEEDFDLDDALELMAQLRREQTPIATATALIAPRKDHWKLYYRARGDNAYSEWRSVEASCQDLENTNDVIRFELPGGLRPDIVRFDPPSFRGCHSLRAMRWGWVDAGSPSVLAPLFDMNLRVLSTSDAYYHETGALSLLSDGDGVYFELSVDDLWTSTAASSSGGRGVLEFVFSRRSTESAVASELNRIRSGVLGMDHPANATSLRQQLMEVMAELSSQVMESRDELSKGQSGLKEQAANADASLVDLLSAMQDLQRKLDSIAVAQAGQSRRVDEIWSQIEVMRAGQDALADAQATQAGVIHRVTQALDELKRVSEMSWWRKQLGRRTKSQS